MKKWQGFSEALSRKPWTKSDVLNCRVQGNALIELVVTLRTAQFEPRRFILHTDTRNLSTISVVRPS